jgi:hypothetical protein
LDEDEIFDDSEYLEERSNRVEDEEDEDDESTVSGEAGD